MGRLSSEAKEFVDAEIRSNRALNYRLLAQKVARRYGIKVSKTTISKRAKALKIQFRRGRKRLIPVGKKPARSIFLDCAGAFFLKGAELEMGLLATVNQLLATSIESAKAQNALKLARQINALLLYAPIFNLETRQGIADYKHRGLLYLSEQKGLPNQEEITQYLKFLVDQKLLLFTIKEVAKACTETLFMQIDFANQIFYLDAQLRTVWPNPKIPLYFSATLNKTKSYIKRIFQSPSLQRPLILQVSPGYTFLPSEMFNLIQCLEKASSDEPISRIVVVDKSGELLRVWQNVKPGQKCFFIAPLSPWQYARLEGTKIVQGFRQYHIGPEKEIMSVADAEVNLFNPQLNKNIRLRAALVRRKEERLALITNISRREERYIRKIAEQYFSRWPEGKVETYYDLLEEAHKEALGRSRSRACLTPFLAIGYSQRPEDAFRLFLEHLHSYAKTHFFPLEYEAETLKSMTEKFYKQSGYLKIKRDCWEIILRPFGQQKLQKDLQIACARFNQMDIEFPDRRRLRIYLQSK